MAIERHGPGAGRAPVDRAGRDVRACSNNLGYAGALWRSTEARWQAWLASGSVDAALSEIQQVADFCGGRADISEKDAAGARSRSFRAWAKEATANGAGRAHAYSRIPLGWKEALVEGGPHPTSPHQRAAETPSYNPPPLAPPGGKGQPCGYWKLVASPIDRAGGAGEVAAHLASGVTTA